MENAASVGKCTVVYVIGRPGAGKTTLVQACMSRMAQERPDLTVAHVDEYELLMDRTKALRADQVRWLGDGTFEVTDRVIFDELLLTLQRRVQEVVLGAACVFVEFSRASYAEAFGKLLPPDWPGAVFVYVRASLELCRKRNRDRPAASRYRSVPDSVLVAFYQEDDLPRIAGAFGERLLIVENESSSLQDVQAAAEKVVQVVANAVGVH